MSTLTKKKKNKNSNIVYKKKKKNMSNFTGFALIILSIALLVHAFTTVYHNSHDYKDAASVSVAISQFDFTGPLFGSVSSEQATDKKSKTTASTTAGGASRMITFVEIATALFLSAVAVAMIAKNSLKTAQRVEVNATSPHSTFDTTVFSGNDFTVFNHRGRRLGRVDNTSR